VFSHQIELKEIEDNKSYDLHETANKVVTAMDINNEIS